MNEHLTEYALRNIWCNPTRDKQQAYRLIRVTGERGAMAYVSINRDTVRLPDTTSHWQVYQAGSVHPNRVGLPNVLWEWKSFADLCRDNQMLAEAYTTEGLQIPKNDVYYFYSNGHGLFVAVRDPGSLFTFTDDNVFVRFYTSVVYGSKYPLQGRGITVINEKVADQTAISELRSKSLNLLANGGQVFVFVNGRFVDEVSLRYISPNDTVEVVYDPTVYKVFDINIKDALTFTSIRDNIRKYLIHPPKDGKEQIDYSDDVDVYLIRKVNDRAGGVYYHHSQPQVIRQVTHRDYAVSIPHVRALFEEHKTAAVSRFSKYPEHVWDDMESLTLRFYVREPGTTRGLVNCANRVKELYRLSDKDIVDQMAGTGSTIPFWRAENLENSAYVRFMGLYPRDFEFEPFEQYTKDSDKKTAMQELVGEVLGYHESARILANTPTKTELINGRRYGYLSYEYWSNATVYEYDEKGYLLGYYPSDAIEVYRCVNDNCYSIDAISGSPGDNIIFSNDTRQSAITVPKGFNYRIIVCPLRRNEPTYEWRDVTYDQTLTDYALVSDNADGSKRIEWRLADRYSFGAVVLDSHYVQNTITLTTDDGLLQFSLNDTSLGYREVSKVPLKHMDVWLNGRYLVKDIDYHVEWPRIVLSCAEHVNRAKKEQSITYRVYGAPQLDGKVDVDEEIGFVSRNTLSRDGRVQFYHNQVPQIMVGGGIVAQSDILFDNEISDAVMSKVRNGAPYSIKCPTRTLRDVFPDDEKAKVEDDARNKLVSDLYTVKFPIVYDAQTEFIEYRYNVISCFAQKILTDIVNDTNMPDFYKRHYSEQDLLKHYESYSWLLTFDVGQYAVDAKRVKVIPHWFNEAVVLPYYKYTLYQRILKAFLKYTIDTTNFIMVKETMSTGD